MLDNVPTWVLIWAAAQSGLGLLFLLLRSVKRGQTIISLPPGQLPGGSSATAVEQDYTDRFTEARFDV